MTEDRKQPLVLIVDDVKMLAGYTQHVVENFGFKTAVRYNATTAIAFVGNNDVDLILLDVELQDSLLNGIDTARLIQGKRDIPIIFITGHEDIDVFRSAEFSAPIYVLLKPYEPKQLKISIETAIFNREITNRSPIIDL